MGQQVLNIKNASHLIHRALIDRNARVVVLNHTRQYVRKLRTEVERHNILPTGHHLFGRLVTEANNTLQHVLLFLQLVLVGQFKRLLQVVHTQSVVLFLNNLLGQKTGTYQNRGQRIEHPAERYNGSCKSAANSQGMLSAIHLRHDFAKQKQQKSKQNRNHDKLYPIGITKAYRMGKEIVAKHNDGHIHQIVRNKNSGQCAFRILAKHNDTGVGFALPFIEFVQVGRRK